MLARHCFELRIVWKKVPYEQEPGGWKKAGRAVSERMQKFSDLKVGPYAAFQPSVTRSNRVGVTYEIFSKNSN